MPSWTVAFILMFSSEPCTLIHLDSIESHFLTPIEKRLFDGTSGPAFYRAKSSLLAAFDRLMALNSIELTPCFCLRR